jgi:two-component system response regulator AtoC
MAVSLVAGRFAPLAGSFAFDLGTGARVRLCIESLQGTLSHPQWAERCATLCGLWHGSMAECLDFGGLGEGHRFLAFRVIREMAGSRQPPLFERTRAQVFSFLSTCGLDLHVLPTPFIDGADRAVAVPAIVPPSESSHTEGTSGHTGRWFGIRLVERAALQIVLEYLDAANTPGLTVHRIDAPLGAGGRTFLRACAREARCRGYVPVSSEGLDWILRQPLPLPDEWIAALSRHHVLFLHDGRQRRLEDHPRFIHALLRLGTREARPPCVVLELTAAGGPRRRLHLASLSEEELVGAVVAPALSARERSALTRAARLSRGRPAPFVKRVAAMFTRSHGGPRKSGYTVHEQSASFGGKHVSGPASSARERTAAIDVSHHMPRRVVDPATARAIDTAIALRAKGRHAAADRALRLAEGAAARREGWVSSAAAALTSARLYAGRGRITAAEAAVHRALEHAERAQDLASTILGVVELGRLRLADGRIEQAESSLRTAVAGCDFGGAAAVARWSATWLALCLWWQGRYDESSRALPSGEGDLSAIQVFRDCTAARLALALHDPSAARVHLTRASELASGAGAPALVAHVRRVEARWHRYVGDVSGFTAAIEDALRMSRLAREPLARLSAVVTHLEGCMALGVRDAGVAITVRRLDHAARGRLPGLLAFRVRMALARFRGSLTARQIAAQCFSRRLDAIPADTSGSPSASSHSLARSRMYDDVIEVLRVCQEEEPLPALQAVAAIVRTRTRAIAAAFTAIGDVAIAAAGPTRPIGTGRRSIETGSPLEPQETDRGIEAAVPLRFGGAIVGALACRWAATPPVETPRLMGLLKAVAAATAPCVTALLEQRTRESRPVGTVELLGESAAMNAIRRAITRAADVPYPVLIQGESGSGKELVARAIHRASTRRVRPLCALNCAALPEDLLEAELFGHARGAFTGAAAERAGLFEEADGGVLFLDEVGELTPRAQAKLLRALQEGEIKRIGETFTRKVDVRLVAATNRTLDEEVAAGRFRADLRYRLDVIRILVPPLRERPEDVAALVQHFWKAAAERVGSRAVLSASALAALARYEWPGNVRELQNVLASLAVAAPRRGVVGPGALPGVIASNAARQMGATLESARRLFEERYVRAALARSGGHRGRAAAELGLTRQGLAKLMGRLGVNHPPDATAVPAETRV